MEQLHTVEVYTAEKVTVEWELKLKRRDVRTIGRAESGRVKVTAADKILKIFLREHDVDAACPPLELEEEMTKFCGIANPIHTAILHRILMVGDLKEIEDVMQRKGIPDDVPEFDTMLRNLAEGGTFHSESNFTSTPLETSNGVERKYRGRKARREAKFRHPLPQEYDSMDVMQSFVEKFHIKAAIKDMVTQPWEASQAEKMLSHICRLEDMNPYSLLPQKRDPFQQKVKQAGGFPDDQIGLIFNNDETANSLAYLSRSAQTFPAIVEVKRSGGIHVRVSTAVHNTTDEEVLLAGELYVRNVISASR